MASVCIRNRSLVSAHCTLFDETGRVHYLFQIFGRKMQVERKEIRYLKPFMEVKSAKDMNVTSRTDYFIPISRFRQEAKYKDDAKSFAAIQSGVAE